MPSNIAALTVELEQAKRAEKLTDTILQLQRDLGVTGRDSTVTLVSKVTGASNSTVTIFINAAFAFCIEILAIFLLYEVLRNGKPVKATRDEIHAIDINDTQLAQQISTIQVPEPMAAAMELTAVEKKLNLLKQAIRDRKIRATVKDIRLFLKCGQSLARKYRAMIVGDMANDEILA